MSILRSVIFNIRERITSGDLNQLQAEAAVNSQAAARAQSRSGAEVTALPIPFQGRNNLKQLSGLAPTPGAADVIELTPGSLATYSPTYPLPTPPLAYTSWKFFNGLDAVANLPIAVPIPVGLPQWYLLEARVGEAITSQVRDIRNLFTGIFAPALVPKALDTTLETQFVAGVPGGGWPTPTGAEWVPICQIRRTNVGGLIPAADVWDLRPLPSDLQGYASQAAQNRQGAFDWRVVAPNSLELTTVEPARAQGLSLEAGAFTVGIFAALDLTTVHDVLDGAFLASTSYHLYLAPWWGTAPRRLDLPYTRGRLILSTQAPTLAPFGAVTLAPSDRVWSNSGVMLDPGPGGTVQIGEAIYLGSVQRNQLNNGFALSSSTSRHVRCNGEQADYGQKTYTQAGAVVQPFAVPPCATGVDVALAFGFTGPGPATATVLITQYGIVGTGGATATVAGPTIQGETEFAYDAAYDGPDPVVTAAAVQDALGAAPPTWFLILSPVGWRW